MFIQLGKHRDHIALHRHPEHVDAVLEMSQVVGFVEGNLDEITTQQMRRLPGIFGFGVELGTARDQGERGSARAQVAQ